MGIFRRAVGLSFETIAQAQGFLRYLEGIYFYPEKTFLHEAKRPKKRKIRTVYYSCYCFVRACDKELFSEVLDQHYPTIASKAALLGLHLQRISVHVSPRAITGRLAFPEGEAMRPLPNLTKQELKELL